VIVQYVPIMTKLIMAQTLTAENEDEGAAAPPHGVLALPVGSTP
jgi:hypothetical protein